jgi:hypothetical protein
MNNTTTTTKPYYVIVGRRWFSFGAGNTYHSTEVYKNGVLLKRREYEYGYGDQYRQTAHEILIECEEWPPENEHFKSGVSKSWYEWQQETRNNRPHWLFIVTDVQRKSDL